MAGKLIIINGPPASGKSTLGRMYTEQHPEALLLDIDELRAELYDPSDRTKVSGLSARKHASDLAKAHLTKNKDVVVAQAYGKEEPLQEWERLAEEVGADYHEFILALDKERIARRYAGRAEATASEFAAHQEDLSTVEELAARIERTGRARRAKVITQMEGQPEESYQELLQQLSMQSDQ